MVEYNVKIKDVEPLTEGRWAEWSQDIEFAFLEAGMADYLDGSNEPADTDSKKVHAEWKSINSRIIGTLGKHVSRPLAQDLWADMPTAIAWAMLKKKTQQDGIFAKLEAMRIAMRTRFSYATPTTSTASDISISLARIFDGDQAPTREEWSIVLLLSTLDDTDYEWLRLSLVSQFVNSKTTPSEKDILEAIHFAGHKRQCKTAEQAHVAKISKDVPQGKKQKCTNPNCKSTKHTIKNCWYEGGGAVDKAPEWWKLRQAANKKSGQKSTQANVATESEKTGESANLAFMPGGDRFEDGYVSLACIVEGNSVECSPEHWSGNWTADTLKPAHICKQSCAATCTPLLYCIDSGCTSHCSPVRSDFISLMPIPHRAVQGMNGSSIPAIARGTIVLKCGKGRKITLQDALFVPAAALRLISVGRLADDGLVTSFDGSLCHIRTRSGKTMADGRRKGQGLYYLSGDDPKVVERAFISRSLPDLATWHRRLGHVNYSSIITMAKKSLALGMPTSFSALPPICEHCVATKQMKTPVPKTRGGMRAQRKLEKVYSDISGPKDVGTAHGEK